MWRYGRKGIAVKAGIRYNQRLMELILQSVNYHDCPVEHREKVSLANGQLREMLSVLLDQPGVAEAAILQTCNRTEIYLYAQNNIEWGKALGRLMGEHLGPESRQTWQKFCKEKRGIEVARNLFNVSAGLDSQMLGENQILSQVKAAYVDSIECQGSRFIFHRLFHTAFRVGKAVRTQTDINCGAVSISLAAVELAKEKMNLWSSAGLVIGAGENAELAAKYLVKDGIGSVVIANRSRDKAEELSKRLGAGRVITLDEVAKTLSEVDLVIASTGAAEPVVVYRDVRDILKKRTKPLLMIDIAVPRDIDEKIGGLKGVTVVNIDDLDRRIAVNKKKRSSEIPKAGKIVDDFTDKFARWLESLSVVPIVSQLTQKAMELARSEAKRYAKDFGEKNAAKLEKFAESLARKLVHGPVSFIKDADPEDPSSMHLRAMDLVNQMFLLDDEDKE